MILRAFAVAALFAFAPLAVPSVAQAADGAAVWKKKCKKCHGDAGKGDSKMGKKMKVADMTTAEWQKKYDDAAIKKAITEGVDRKDGDTKKKMKGYKDLAAEEIDALIKLIRSFAS